MQSFWILFLGLVVSSAAWAQESAAAEPPPADCSAAEYRAFDFWVGAWNVSSDGQYAGTNDVTAEYGGCALREHWQGSDGGKGTSLNGYDRKTQRWKQLWIDDRGALVELVGGLEDEAMVMSSKEPGNDGRNHRVSWTPQPDGDVRQLWQSRRGDENWVTVFDGRYRRR